MHRHRFPPQLVQLAVMRVEKRLDISVIVQGGEKGRWDHGLLMDEDDVWWLGCQVAACRKVEGWALRASGGLN